MSYDKASQKIWYQLFLNGYSIAQQSYINYTSTAEAVANFINLLPTNTSNVMYNPLQPKRSLKQIIFIAPFAHRIYITVKRQWNR